MPATIDGTRFQKLSKPRDAQFASAIVGMRQQMPIHPAHIPGRPLDQWITDWVFICMERNATAFAQHCLRMFKRDGQTIRGTKAINRLDRKYLKSAVSQQNLENAVEVLDHPFLDVIDYVNPLYNQYTLWWTLASHLQIHGVAFWKLKFDGMKPAPGRIVEIWPVPPQYMRIKLSKGRIIEEYEYRYTSEVVRFSPDEIIYFRRPSPIDNISGLGNLRAMVNASETNLRMMEYQNALFGNEAMPASIISLEGETSDTQVKQLITDLESRHRGWRNAGRPAAYPGKVSITKLTDSNKELQFKDTQRQHVERIAAGFGVPIHLILSQGATFQNVRHATNLWTRQTIGPMQRGITETLNSEIAPLYSDIPDDGLTLRKKSTWFFAFPDPTFEDVDADSERFVRDANNPAKTLDETRAENGLPPLPDGMGDEPLWPGGVRRPSEPIPGAVPEGAAMERDADGNMVPVKPEGDGAADDESSQIAQQENDPVSLNDLSLAIERLMRAGDEATVNILRNALADFLGVERPPHLDVSAALQDVGELGGTGGTGGQGGDGADNPNANEAPKKEGEEEKKKPKPKPEDKAADLAGHEDGYTHLAKAILAVHGKLALQLFDEDNFDKRFAAKLVAVLQDLEMVVKRSLDTLLIQAQKQERVEYNIPNKKLFIDALFNQEEWAEKIVEASEPFLLQAFNVGVEAGFKDIQSALADAGRMKLGTERIERQLKRFTERFASEVVAVQGEDLYKALKAGMEEGERPEQLFKRVADIYGGDRGDHNAERIVRTEMSRAMNAGAQEQYKAADVTENEWLASVDACEFCLKLKGNKVPLGKAFVKNGETVIGVKGGSYTAKYGDVNHPPLHPHDTCTIVPVLE